MSDRPPATARLLGGRRGGPAPSPRGPGGTDAHRYKREIGAHPGVADYESGPFMDQAVQPLPALAVELLERRTGRRVHGEGGILELVAEWERIRAFVAYEGVEITPALQVCQRLEDDHERGEPTAPAVPERAAHLAAQRTHPELPRASGVGQPDPHDLGDP